ncbi:protein of unknown function [Nakamurella panacisegetis]|uniref:DUF1905 domain-containing protein n=1 Tax=Nakamurella panacisegetis TaxID=1090615 RepID=A0A1H0IQL3_9ACTN|nr:DUF1905 domain-containing protein [Nakamurella panacisegetis]SDO33688.1 protein of unknown function [Nakamurella panacisegetis]
MEFVFDGEIWYWRGPSPYHFLTIPDGDADAIGAQARELTYGWGMIPVQVRIGRTEWRTAMFAKDGGYVLPIRDNVRRAEDLHLGDEVTARVRVLEPVRRPR